MDHLKEIIQTFDKDAINDFSSFIHRSKQKKDRKDLELFNLMHLQPEMKSSDMLSQLYSDKNKEAYHALRKRLMKHIVDFLYLRRINEDYTKESQVMGMISLSRYLNENGKNRMALKYLKKAEEMAIGSELFALGNTILGIRLENFPENSNQDIEAILNRKGKYKRLSDEDDNANTAYSIIKYRLQKAKQEAKDENFNIIIEDVLKKYSLSDAVINRPSILFKLMSIIRSAVLASKDFFAFEPIIMKHYNTVESTIGFQPKDGVYKSGLLYMIAHTLYRNKKFEKAKGYLDQMLETIQSLNKSVLIQFLPKYTMLLGAINFFSGNIETAMKIAENTLKRHLELRYEDVLNMRLNYGIYKFFVSDFKGANQIILEIAHSNKWYSKVVGYEWVLKKCLMEVLIQYELGNVDISENIIRSMLRTNELLTSSPRYERVITFLMLVQDIIDNPELVTSEAFFEKVENSFDWIPIEQEDLHASVFYSWMKAKMMKRDKYEVLLELINL